MSGRPHPAVERYVAGLISPAARIAQLEAQLAEARGVDTLRPMTYDGPRRTHETPSRQGGTTMQTETQTTDFPFAHVPAGGIVNHTTLAYPQQGVLNTPPYPVELTYVLVRGAAEDVAVYVGRGEPDWVVEHGVKLPHREAICHFPHLEQRWYRR